MAAAAKKDLNDPVLRHLRTDVAKLHVNLTVGEALEQIRSQPPEGRIIYFYVVDSEGVLKGVLPTRRLLLNPLESKISAIMVRDVVAIPASATALDACEFFVMHRLLAFPVVDENRKLLGAVDVELYTSEWDDLERRQQHDDLFQLIGVHLTEAQTKSSWTSFRKRFPWLMCNICGGIAAAFLSGVFEKELEHAAVLALFIPVVLALAESVSIQSVSLTLQHLRGQHLTWRGLFKKMRQESTTGLLLGVASGLMVGSIAVIWRNHLHLALCLWAAIGVGVVFASAVGAAMPILLRFFKRDPQVAAGPVALASADLFTLFVYFSLARWMLALQ